MIFKFNSLIREGSFNMTRRGGGAPKFLDSRKGGSEKTVGLGGLASKICILQNQQERGAPKKLNR